MKALTLTQPWATLVAIGAKKIETRSWTTDYRGLLAIHAAKGVPGEARETCDEEPFTRVLAEAGIKTADDLPLGAIVAVGELWDVIPTTRVMLLEQEGAFGDFSPGRYAWLLNSVVELITPIPCKGMLGLWTPPEEIERQL